MVAAVGGVCPLSASTAHATADKGAVDEFFGFLRSTREHELADGGKLVRSGWIPGGGVHRTAPHRAFAEGDGLSLYATIGEHPHTAVAQGKCLHHTARRAVEEVREALSISRIGEVGGLCP